MRRYTTKDAAELLGLTSAQVRAFVREGLVSPARGPRDAYRFSFQDIILLRAAKELMRARIVPHKVRRALHRVRDQLPTGRPLTSVRISSEADRIVVRDEGTVWNVESGQIQFDFSVSEMADRLAPVARRVAAEANRSRETMEADDWYHLGLELEPVEPTSAENAYQKAVAADPEHPEAHINLGRLLHERGNPEAAAAHYRAATGSAPENAIAAYNLGTALEDLDLTEAAIDAYQRAIELDPRFIDAHFNLARLYEQTGALQRAIRHLRSYRGLTR